MTPSDTASRAAMAINRKIERLLMDREGIGELEARKVVSYSGLSDKINLIVANACLDIIHGKHEC